MESLENIKGQAADEQMVRSCRIEFEDPGMQQEKESEEESEDEREKESEEEREDERKDEKEEEEIHLARLYCWLQK
jgi:hypothetical protein